MSGVRVARALPEPYNQETEGPDGSWRVVDDASLVFEFGTGGELLEVYNTTWLVPLR